MFTLKIYEEDPAFLNVDDAVKYIKETDFEKDVTVYDIDTQKACEKARKLYKVIKEYNKGKALQFQCRPGNPFSHRGIVGCLGVQCYSISLGKYEHNKDLIALFTGWNKDVLDMSAENC